MPGFDIATSHSHTSRMRDARGWFGRAGASGLAGVGVGMVDVSVLPDMSQFGAFGVALAAAVVGGLILAGKVRGVHERLRAELTEHRLPITHQLRVPPAKPVKENKLDDGRVVPARGGGYAFDHRAFLVGQEIPVSVIAPHAGNASGETSTAVREPTVKGRNLGLRFRRRSAHQRDMRAVRTCCGILAHGRASR